MLDILRTLASRLRRTVHRSEFERLLDNELRAHVDAETEELVRAGHSPEEARRRAVASFGGFDRWRDEARETRLGHQVEIFARSLRLALRSLRRSPSYTLPAVATIALGIAALASIATLAYDILLRPLPYDKPSRLVAVYEKHVPRQRDRNVVSAAAMLAWRQRSRTMDSVSGLMPSSASWVTRSGAEQLSGAEVSPGLFALLGRRPMLGAGFSGVADAQEVMFSYGFWIRRLGGDSSVVGKHIQLDGRSVTVVGVMPQNFEPVRYGWMGDQEFWLPMTIGPQQIGWGRFLLVVARLRPGATLDAANREVRAIHAQLRADGTIAEGWDAQVFSLSDEVSGSVRAPLTALLLACAVLLVMVLTNTTLLTIAQARKRAADRALRAVLGATRGRLLMERLLSMVLVALCGAVVGLAVSVWAIGALTRLLPQDVPRLETVHFGTVAMIVGLTTSAITAVVLTLIPALDTRAGDLGETAATLQGGDRMTRGARTAWVVVGEAAAAVVLAVFAGLTLRSYERLSSVDIGFDPTGLMAFRVSFDGQGNDSTMAVGMSRRFLEQIRAIPGVTSVGRITWRPFFKGGTATTVTPPGWGDRDRSAFPTAQVRWVDAEYFRTLDLKPTSGRLFLASDARAPLRAVVNETFVKKLWPGETRAVGRSFDLRLGPPLGREIIGVVRDVRMSNVREEARPTVYLFTEQQSSGEDYDILLRTTRPQASVLADVRRIAQSVAPSRPIYRVESMQQTVNVNIARERVTAQLLVVFAAAALLLVAVGVYGLYAGEVTRRRREIGVRMALGATSSSVVGSFVARAMARTVAGVVIGGVVGFAASRVLESVLYGIQASDPLSYAGASMVVLVVALGATLLPARQASRVDPGSALRSE
jgi:predicted permease